MQKILKNLGQGFTIGLGIVLAVLLGGISYATWLDLTDVGAGNPLTADMFNKVLENQRDLKASVDSGLSKNYCYGHSPTTQEITTATWTTIADFTGCNIISSGKDLKITLDFSAYGTYHGGIRLLDTVTGDVYGNNSSYGFDWVMPLSNARYKRNITRILNVPAGNHNFVVQVRAQSNGSLFRLHGGTSSDNYSGLYLIIEEM